MPSTTFLNLPQEKRDRVLSAAIREFSQHPYGEASLNQIIRDAGISRGGFYLYFKDKTELFAYLLSVCGYVAYGVLSRCLRENEGDVFALPAFLQKELLLLQQDAPRRERMEEMARMLRVNRDVVGQLVPQDGHGEMTVQLMGLMNRSTLSVDTAEEWLLAVELILGVASWHLMEWICGENDPAVCIDRLEIQMRLLRRGLAPAGAAEQ